MLNFLQNVSHRIQHAFTGTDDATNATHQKKSKKKHRTKPTFIPDPDRKAHTKNTARITKESSPDALSVLPVVVDQDRDLSVARDPESKPRKKPRYKNTVRFDEDSSADPVNAITQDNQSVPIALAASNEISGALQDKAKDLTTELERIKPLPSVKTETQKEELLRKAKEIRHRTHNRNKYYKGKGKDAYGLHGQPLKSVFEDDQGNPLPVAERQQILRELQRGERKRHFK